MRRFPVLLVVAAMVAACGGEGAEVPSTDSDTSSTAAAVTTSTAAAVTTSTAAAVTTSTAAAVTTSTAAAVTTELGPADPTPNVPFSGVIEGTSTGLGTLSFTVTESGLIERLTIDDLLIRMNCGSGNPLSVSVVRTYYFWDPDRVVQAGRFSISQPDLEWSGEFDSATSVHGTIRIADTVCGNQPPSVNWTATAEG